MNEEQRRELEDRVRGTEYRTSPGRDQHVLNTLLREYEEYEKPTRRMEKIKMILFCRNFVKAALVVVVAVIVIGGLWQGGTNDAWALEELLTALERVRTMHVRGTLLYGVESEARAFRFWVQAPDEESGPLRMRFECSKLVILVEGERVYMCRPDKGWVLQQHGPDIEYFMPWYDAAELGPWISGKMYEALQEVFADWEESVVTDPKTGRKKIIVSCRYVPTNMAFRAVVDSETKLIDSAEISSSPSFNGLNLHVDAQTFAYNQDIPPGTFAIPDGMMIIDEAALREAEALLEKAMPLFEEKQYSEALVLYQQVCDEYPGLPNEVACAHIMKGHCYRELGQQEKVIKSYHEAIETATAGGRQDFGMSFNIATAYLSIGRTCMEQGQNARALEAFETCIQKCEDWAEPEKWPHKEALDAIEQLRNP